MSLILYVGRVSHEVEATRGLGIAESEGVGSLAEAHHARTLLFLRSEVETGVEVLVSVATGNLRQLPVSAEAALEVGNILVDATIFHTAVELEVVLHRGRVGHYAVVSHTGFRRLADDTIDTFGGNIELLSESLVGSVELSEEIVHLSHRGLLRSGDRLEVVFNRFDGRLVSLLRSGSVIPHFITFFGSLFECLRSSDSLRHASGIGVVLEELIVSGTESFDRSLRCLLRVEFALQRSDCIGEGSAVSLGNSVDERVLTIVSAFVNAEFRTVEVLVAVRFTVAYGLGHFHAEVLVFALIGGELEVRRTGEVGLLHIGAIVVLPRYGVGIAEGRNNERIPTFVLLPSVEVNDVVAVFVGYHVAVLVHLLSLAGFEGSVSLGTPDRDLFGCTAVGVTVVTLHPLEEEFALGVVELELEEVVALPSIVTAVPAGVEVGFGVAVEEDSGAVLFAHTFFLVSHEAREVFAVGDQTIVGKCTAGRLLEAVARSINTHVSEALVVGSLCLGDELLCLLVVDVLFGALEQVLYFLFGDGARLEGRSVSLPVPNYGTVVVTAGVHTAELPTIAAVVAPVVTLTAPEVGRVEAEVAGVVAAGHDVVGSFFTVCHLDASTGHDVAVGGNVLSRTHITLGGQVLEEEVTGLSLVLRHLPDVLQALVVEYRIFLIVSDVTSLISPTQLIVLLVHCAAIIECTTVIAGLLRAVRGEDVVTGLEHLTRSGEGSVSLGQIDDELVNVGFGCFSSAVEDLLRLVVKCQERVILYLVVFTDVVTARELLRELIDAEVCAE